MPKQLIEASKKTDAKPRKTSKKATTKSEKGNGNGDARHRMISEAAYYRALGRGFDGGDTLQDWLVAEEQIDLILRT